MWKEDVEKRDTIKQSLINSPNTFHQPTHYTLHKVDSWQFVLSAWCGGVPFKNVPQLIDDCTINQCLQFSASV